jgi:hypothetical protein
MLATTGPGDTITLWEVATWKKRGVLTGHEAACLAFSPDSRVLATGGDDTLVMGWDLTGRMAGGRLRRGPTDRKALDALWGRLGDDDPARAYEAVWALVATPRESTRFLRARLPLVSEADLRRVQRLIVDLDDDEFAVRQRATMTLEGLGFVAEGSLRDCLEGKPSAEVRHRVRDLLRKLQATPSQEGRRGLRLVEVLEQIGTVAAKEALEALAKRAAGTQLRHEAKGALGRGAP